MCGKCGLCRPTPKKNGAGCDGDGDGDGDGDDGGERDTVPTEIVSKVFNVFTAHDAIRPSGCSSSVMFGTPYELGSETLLPGHGLTPNC